MHVSPTGSGVRLNGAVCNFFGGSVHRTWRLAPVATINPNQDSGFFSVCVRSCFCRDRSSDKAVQPALQADRALTTVRELRCGDCNWRLAKGLTNSGMRMGQWNPMRTVRFTRIVQNVHALLELFMVSMARVNDFCQIL